MPIYEYQCQECDERSEEMQSLNDPPLETCRKCAGPLRKLMSAPAFQFKGTGWYVTDYGKGESSGAKSSSSESNGSSDESSSASDSEGSSSSNSSSKSTSSSKSESSDSGKEKSA